jgi:hypothetical protein
VLLFISYDLNTAERPEGSAAFEAVLEKHSTARLQTAPSQWFVDTSDDVAAWGTRLAEILKPPDRVVIVRVPNVASANGWLPKANWDWIAEHAS